MNGAEASRLLGACSKDQPENRCDIGHELTVPSAATATYTFNRQAIRSNYMDKSIDAKKKVSATKTFINVFRKQKTLIALHLNSLLNSKKLIRTL